MKKKVDERIRILIENGVKLRHRSMFVIVGDKYRDQIVNLHFLLGKSLVKSRPSVLWCYKEDLELSSHKRKRLKQTKKLIQRGLLDPEKLDPFLLFVETSNVTHCKYKDSERVLGNTFGMCVLQDFEALTPNLLARTIETVEGGGLVVLVLHSLTSLSSLFAMVMDVHERFRTEAHSLAAGRFNERFLLSLASCKACVVMDDEMNILPISSHIRSIAPVTVSEDLEGLPEAQRDLRNLKEKLHNEVVVGPLIKRCSTVDQAKALNAFFDAIVSKTLRSVVALIAARGRGKSASLGLAIAAAIAAGFSNIFVTAPTPENVKTLFEFVCNGLTELEYKEHLHYDLIRSPDPNLKKSIVQINIYKKHKQTVQYLPPNEHTKLSQVELLVIDEAAAIPLPLVKAMLGPYLVFLSSTVNGYEGTGRSLSLKLLQQLEHQSKMPANSLDGPHGAFTRIELHESIRYASNDPIESWLNGLLCLDVANCIPSIARLPQPDECDVYYVNRDTLFSYHKDSEVFLQRMMALYVASHYKNSPNDLQLMADAPAHHLFVLLGPVDESKNQLPDILCVVQICLEGQISKKSAMRSLSVGHQPSGDQIPWKFSEQFRDVVFPTLSGARIVRIAVHPNAQRLGYGSHTVKLLTRYYEGKITHFTEEEEEEHYESPARITEIAEKVSLLEENIKPKTNLPPLLVHLRERNPEKLHYLGVSFGLTHELFRFWRRHKFVPFYICHSPNNVTGEHNCMVLKALHNDEIENNEKNPYGFILPYYQEFREEFIDLLGVCFQNMNYNLAMSILAPKINFDEQETALVESVGSQGAQGVRLKPYLMKRLEDYSNNSVDYHTIRTLVCHLARSYFLEELPVTLSPVQAAVLLCIGLQRHDIPHIVAEMKFEKPQIMSFFNKVMRKFYKYLNDISLKELGSTLPPHREIVLQPFSTSLDDELNEAAKEAADAMKIENEVSLDPELLRKYAIVDKDADFENALKKAGKIPVNGIVSVKTTKHKRIKDRTEETEKSKANGRKKRVRH